MIKPLQVERYHCMVHTHRIHKCRASAALISTTPERKETLVRSKDGQPDRSEVGTKPVSRRQDETPQKRRNAHVAVVVP